MGHAQQLQARCTASVINLAQASTAITAVRTAATRAGVSNSIRHQAIHAALRTLQVEGRSTAFAIAAGRKILREASR